MDRPEADGPPRRGMWTKQRIILAAAAGVLVLALVAFGQVRAHQLQSRMLTMFPNDVPADAQLSRYAASLAKPAYAKNCASCHGADMKGDQKKGAPDLTDDVWLFDFGNVQDIENTILYGIRSGIGKSRNITDMPGLGLSGRLYPYEVADATSYVLYVNTGKTTDEASVKRGSAIFQDKGVCYDCHTTNATGNSDYGAPSLTDKDWLFGGDYDTIYHSIYYGRHGKCPAWVTKLSAAQIRSLAVYLYMNSKKPAPPQTASATIGEHNG